MKLSETMAATQRMGYDVTREGRPLVTGAECQEILVDWISQVAKLEEELESAVKWNECLVATARGKPSPKKPLRVILSTSGGLQFELPGSVTTIGLDTD